MSTTTNEKVGDVILGAHLVYCHHDTRWDKRGHLRLVRSPLRFGQGHNCSWTKKETRPGGWHREVPMVLGTDASDPTRATSRFRVVSVKQLPTTTGSYMGRDDGYGGGPQITVKRLDGTGERIVYTRRCGLIYDVDEPAILVLPDPESTP
jgi:hypothetical protein